MSNILVMNGFSQAAKSPTVAVLADGQNVNVIKYSKEVLKVANTLGDLIFLKLYHHWDRIKLTKIHRVKTDGWEAVPVLGRHKNALDDQAIQECQDYFHDSNMPDILILITGDKDFAGLVESFLAASRRVIIIGRRNSVSHRLKRLVKQDCLWVEELSNCFLPSLEN